jgi:hypothetical protein
MHRNHVRQMLIGGGVALAVLLMAGVPLGQALPLAAALACPLMMIFMMRSMGGQSRHGGCGHGNADHGAGQGASGSAPEAQGGTVDRPGTSAAESDAPPAVR